MLDEGGAEFLELLVEIVALARQAHSALIGIEGVDLAVLLVGVDPDAEKPADSPVVQGGERAREVGGGGDGGDPRELGPDGLQAGGIDRRGIHRRFEEIADLLLDRAGLVRARRRGFEDAPERLLVELLELVEAAPARLVGRHGIVLLPRAESVARKVGARIGARVHVVHAEAGRDGPGGFGREERQAGERGQGRGGEGKAGASHGSSGKDERGDRSVTGAHYI